MKCKRDKSQLDGRTRINTGTRETNENIETKVATKHGNMELILIELKRKGNIGFPNVFKHKKASRKSANKKQS